MSVLEKWDHIERLNRMKMRVWKDHGLVNVIQEYRICRIDWKAPVNAHTISIPMTIFFFFFFEVILRRQKYSTEK